MKLVSIVPILGSMLVMSVALSFIHPWGNLRSATNAPLLEGSTIPVEVRQILETKCVDCHSGNTHWPSYSRLAPASWFIEYDVHEGRSHLDLSQWQRYDQESQIDLLARIASEARSGEMPIQRYLVLHPKAKLSPAEQQLLYDWAKSERKRIRQQLVAQPDKTSDKVVTSGK